MLRFSFCDKSMNIAWELNKLGESQLWEGWFAADLVDVLWEEWHPWSDQAKEVVAELNGDGKKKDDDGKEVEKKKISLRPDGKIDFPELWLTGCRMLRENDAVVAFNIQQACDAAKTNNCILLNEAETTHLEKIPTLKEFLTVKNFDQLFRHELEKRVGYDKDNPYAVCYWLGQNNQKHLLKKHVLKEGVLKEGVLNEYYKNVNIGYTLFLCFDEVE